MILQTLLMLGVFAVGASVALPGTDAPAAPSGKLSPTDSAARAEDEGVPTQAPPPPLPAAFDACPCLRDELRHSYWHEDLGDQPWTSERFHDRTIWTRSRADARWPVVLLVDPERCSLLYGRGEAEDHVRLWTVPSSDDNCPRNDDDNPAAPQHDERLGGLLLTRLGLKAPWLPRCGGYRLQGEQWARARLAAGYLDPPVVIVAGSGGNGRFGSDDFVTTAIEPNSCASATAFEGRVRNVVPREAVLPLRVAPSLLGVWGGVVAAHIGPPPDPAHPADALYYADRAAGDARARSTRVGRFAIDVEGRRGAHVVSGLASPQRRSALPQSPPHFL